MREADNYFALCWLLQEKEKVMASGSGPRRSLARGLKCPGAVDWALPSV
jgi:hypothetical protein